MLLWLDLGNWFLSLEVPKMKLNLVKRVGFIRCCKFSKGYMVELKEIYKVEFAHKYWKPDQLTVALHLFETIIKFVRN